MIAMRSGAPCVRLGEAGMLRGTAEEGLAVFRGIRYAQPPVGALRFRAPVAAQPWEGWREARDFAPVPPQWPRGGAADAASTGDPDCLALNVWVPTRDAAADMPVMVWVPGGGFMRGGASDPLYDGASFARQGVVFVSLQYRLGVDGFLHDPEEGAEAPANRGLLDILCALQWVARHIHAFGGDPARITVFGESAGAGALACLLGMPAAHGLFARAILQSPSVACQSRDEAGAVRQAIAALLQVPATLAAIASVPRQAVLHAVHRLATQAALRAQHGIGQRNFFPLRPVVDGVVLAEPPLAALDRAWQSGQSALQILVGSNAEEMRLYHVPLGAIDGITHAQLAAFMRDVALPAAAHAVYAALPACRGGQHAGEMLCAMQTDYYYRAPARRIAAMAAQAGLQAHLYEFEWRSPQWDGRLGAAHGMDLPFVFANLGAATGLAMTGPAPPPALAEAMHGAWLRFARDGRPGWPQHTVAQPWVRHFDLPARDALAAASARLDLWADLL